VYRAKSCTSVFLAGKFLFCPFRHFYCNMYDVSFSHKMHRKKSRRKGHCEFFLESGVHWLC